MASHIFQHQHLAAPPFLFKSPAKLDKNLNDYKEIKIDGN